MDCNQALRGSSEHGNIKKHNLALSEKNGFTAFIFMANLKPCSSVKTVGTFMLFLNLNWRTVPVLNTYWKPTESACRDVPGSCCSNVTSMLWNRERLERDYMLLPQMNVSSRGSLLLNFIFTDSESKTIKTSGGNRRIWLGRNDALFMINWGNKREEARFEFFIMPLRRPAKRFSFQAEPQNL